jgi:hypothetical protein
MTASLKFYSATLLGALLIGIGLIPRTAQALPAGEQEVDQNQINQNQFVAIAIPEPKGDTFQFLVVEQVTQNQKCWIESATRPVSIQFLMPNFQRPQFCRQSNASENISIQMAGQNLPQLYELKLVRRNAQVWLVASPTPQASRYPMITLGRTQGISADYTKIILEPGWKFSQRNPTNGTGLGQLYLSHSRPLDLPPNRLNPDPRQLQQSTTVASSQLTRIESGDRAIPIPVPPPQTSAPATFGSTQKRISPPFSTSQPSAAISLVVPPPLTMSRQGRYPSGSELPFPAKDQRGIIPIPPGNPFVLFPTESPGTGSPADEPTLESPRALPANGQLLPVPDSNIPLGNAGNDPGLIARAEQLPPPPLGSLAFGPRLRVMVSVLGQDRQTQLRSLVPDAFRCFHQGQPMMQVGSFTEPAQVEEMIILMTRHGFVPVVVKSL